MKTLIGISIIVCILNLTSAQTNCTGVEDTLIESSCTTYKACKNQTYVEETCSSGEVVDEERMVCDNRANVPLPCGGIRNCTGLSDGNYPDFLTNCTSFYSCQNSVNLGRTFCPSGLVYDARNNYCNRVDDVCTPCGNRICLSTEAFTGSTEELTTTNATTATPIYRNCTGRRNGFHADVESNCTWYFRCADGNFGEIYRCPSGLVFDPEDLVCDWPYAACPPCGNGESKADGYCKNCTGVPDGLQPDLDDFCSGAYECESGLMSFRAWCQAGSVYDPEIQNCNNDTDDVCPPCYNGSGNPPDRCFPTTDATTTEPPITDSTDSETSDTNPPATQTPTPASTTIAPTAALTPGSTTNPFATDSPATTTPAALAKMSQDKKDDTENGDDIVQMDEPKFPQNL